MRGILEVPKLAEVEWHACPNGCTCWQPIPRAEWEAHANDKCSRRGCKGERFRRDLNGNLVPERVSWVWWVP